MKKTLYVLLIITLSVSLFSPYIDHWLANLWVHFKLQFAVLFLISLIISLVYKLRSMFTVYSVIGLMINVLPLISLYAPNEMYKEDNGNDTALLSINLWSQNTSYNRVNQLINTKEPDIIILLEYTPDWHNQLQPVLNDYPYHAKEIRTDNFGMAVYSKLPMKHDIIIKEVPAINAEIIVNGQSFQLLARHPNPPMTAANYSALKQSFYELKNLVQNKKQPVIVAGDLNTSGYTFFFKDLIRETRLKDAFKGKGLQATWPSDLYIFGLKLDHFLVSKSIKLKNAAVVDHINSDHLPIFMRFNLEY